MKSHERKNAKEVFMHQKLPSVLTRYKSTLLKCKDIVAAQVCTSLVLARWRNVVTGDLRQLKLVWLQAKLDLWCPNENNENTNGFRRILISVWAVKLLVLALGDECVGAGTKDRCL